jgi:hypothetical protein
LEANREPSRGRVRSDRSGREDTYHYEEALRETLGGGGDTDTNACIVGGLLGARWGVSAIPGATTKKVLACDTTASSIHGPRRSTHTRPGNLFVHSSVHQEWNGDACRFTLRSSGITTDPRLHHGALESASASRRTCDPSRQTRRRGDGWRVHTLRRHIQCFDALESASCEVDARSKAVDEPSSLGSRASSSTEKYDRSSSGRQPRTRRKIESVVLVHGLHRDEKAVGSEPCSSDRQWCESH